MTMKRLPEYWRLLGDLEDYLTDGYRKPHGPPPESAPDDFPDRATEPTEAGSSVERRRRLAELDAEIGACRKCALCKGRTSAVPGEGALDPLVMVVGEGPGADEDASGRPFVGKAGQYLDKWLEAIGLSRKTNAFIANVVKCRPPNNRDPQPEESAACLPYLGRQIEIVRPRFILTVGRISSALLSGVDVGIGRLRGATYEYRGTRLVPTYHPSGVLRSPELRAPVWEDLRRLRKLLDG